MRRISRAMIASYLQASYFIVDTMNPQVLEARIGERCEGVDALLARHNARSGLVFTAWNPRSEPRSLARNKAANLRLLRHKLIASVGVRCYPSYGADDVANWREDGFFFSGIDEKQAQLLCREFQQNAGVLFNTDGMASLVWDPQLVLPRGG